MRKLEEALARGYDLHVWKGVGRRYSAVLEPDDLRDDSLRGRGKTMKKAIKNALKGLPE